MSSTTKSQKDKPHGVSPRLMPRPTAASAARAAKNATNRNLTTNSLRQSPSRTSSSQPRGKCQTPAPRISQKVDSKPDAKVDQPAIEACEIVCTTDNVIVDETSNVNSYNLANDPLQEISENDVVFVIKREDDDTIENQEAAQLQADIRANVTDRNESFPRTPASSSRPTTPKSCSLSRPQTPRAASRPVTPANVHSSNPASRPNTPQRNPALPCRPNTPQCDSTRPTTPRLLQPQVRTTSPPPRSLIRDEDDIRTAFMVKQRQFNRMKKELDLKQQAILEVFDTLQALRERMSREGVSGGGEGLSEELVVFNVGDWTSEEVAQLCRDAAASSMDGAIELINTSVPIDECALQELDAKVMSVPTWFADLCLQAFTNRQELIDWVKELFENNDFKDALDGGGEYLERIGRYNAQGLELCEALRDLKSRADGVVDTVTQLSRRACRERSALVAVGESLVREIARLRQDIDTRIANITEMREVQAETEMSKTIEELRRELDEERGTKAAEREKLVTAESQLRQMRNRVAKMDRQLREAEASISSLTGTVKTLEDQSRQREVQLEARARKLKESLKTGEMTSGHLTQQRDALQNEIVELKQKIEDMTASHKSAIQDLTNDLKKAKAALDEQQKINQKEVDLRESTETALVQSQILVEDLKAKITEFENNKPNPDLPTEREMDLWAELQATKDTLRITEDEVTACRREKIRFIETLTKIAESENKVGMQQKLAGELLSKEELMGKMQIQIRELTKNIKLNEQKVIQYEQYVRDLQAHNRAVANCQETPNGISYQDLQQEIMNLKMKVLESVHRNEELSELLLQKDQQIEQQDKMSRAQARVIKVREELINMLKNKENEQSRELTVLQQDLEHRMKIVDEVNKQIATKASEIQELFGTLENKQQQIHRLEKIVLALEEQQRRAQAQRIRHEEKIAALEHELAAGGNRRERKFLFF